MPIELRWDVTTTTGGQLVGRGTLVIGRRERALRLEAPTCEALYDRLLGVFEDEAPAPPDVARPFRLLAAPFLDIGSTPAINFGVQLGAAVLVGPVRLVVRASGTLPQSARASSGTLEAMLLSGSLLGCLRATASRQIRFDFCGGIEAGALLGKVEASGEVSRQEVLFLAADAGVLFNLALWDDNVDLLVSADLLIPMVRDPFFVPSSTDPVLASEVVGGRFGLGLAFRL
ncbi:MAG: hypothetical protein R3B82_20935 [Sandaracinaceae bacterium]